ncbi:MAG: DUF6029 family protein [Bacteroidota bacterium]
MRKLAFLSLFSCTTLAGFGQIGAGNINGNVESIFQYLNSDSLIGADQPASKGLLNTYMNVFYTNGPFKAGIRMESYLPRIQGYPNRFDGTGLGMRYVGYANDWIDATVGSFYEQFGTGIALRAYEDRNLGYDNQLDGVRLIVRPVKGLTVKGVYGYQRLSFQEGKIVHAAGIVRGIDGEINLNTTFTKLKDKRFNISLGGSFVSKYQVDDNDLLILPQNVATYGGRAKFSYSFQKSVIVDGVKVVKPQGILTFNGEYVQKEQDPSSDNGYIYNYGHAAVFNVGYSRKGLGILFSAKSVDNMSSRSDRTKDLQDVLINFLPAMNKTHTYNLVATLYPYATQPLGEIAYQTEILYTIPKGTKLGGKYGTALNFNSSIALKPMQHTSGINPADSTGVIYVGRPFDSSDSLMWLDVNFNITKKINKKFNLILSYFHIQLNNDIAKATNDAQGIIKSHIGVLELGYKINAKHSIRAELQGMFLQRAPNGNIMDKGNWATALIEYSVSPSWFLSVMNQYNYGNPNKELRLNYPIVSAGFIKDATRFMVSYGRQRAGLFCVGGVCRFVPASNGLTLSFTQSF